MCGRIHRQRIDLILEPGVIDVNLTLEQMGLQVAQADAAQLEQFGETVRAARKQAFEFGDAAFDLIDAFTIAFRLGGRGGRAGETFAQFGFQGKILIDGPGDARGPFVQRREAILEAEGAALERQPRLERAGGVGFGRFGVAAGGAKQGPQPVAVRGVEFDFSRPIQHRKGLIGDV